MEETPQVIDMITSPASFLEYYRRKEVSLSSGAVYMAIKLAFPDQIDPNQHLPILDKLINLQIASNNFCDLVIPLKNQPPPVTPSHQEAKFTFRNKIESDLTKEKARFLEKYPAKHDLVEAYLNDSKILAESSKPVTPEEVRTFLEIDSAIFEAACLAVCIPDTLSSAGFDAAKPCDSFADLKSKYSFFTDPPPEGQPIRSRVFGLHSAEMVLKIIDDIQGREEDRLIGSPSFAEIFSQASHGSLGKYISKASEYLSFYRKRAKDTGFQLPQLVSEAAFWIRPIRMSSRKQDPNQNPLELHQIDQALDKNPRQLREWLNRLSILPEIFHSSGSPSR